MRLWSLHPKYLDAAGLVALWREALLAKKVLQGRTKGYRFHPQLVRFEEHPQPVASINRYLHEIWRESERRGYTFDKRKIGITRKVRRIPVTTGQIAFELHHLLRKLRKRNTPRYRILAAAKRPLPHPLFSVRRGPIAPREKGA